MIQKLVFHEDGKLSFSIGGQPMLGMLSEPMAAQENRATVAWKIRPTGVS